MAQPPARRDRSPSPDEPEVIIEEPAPAPAQLPVFQLAAATRASTVLPTRSSWVYDALTVVREESGGAGKKRTHVCRCMAVGADGKQCEWEISVVEGEDRVGNISRHLRSHGITQETLREKAKTIVEQLASAVARKAANRELAAEYKRRLFDFISSAHLPFNIVENEELVALVKFLSGGPGLPQGCQCRQGARDGLIESARQKLARCLKGLAGRPVTLAVDSGTVWRRYFTVVAMCPGELPLIVSMAHDESLGVGGDDHGRQTAENIKVETRLKQG
jgi:hypothetical protein